MRLLTVPILSYDPTGVFNSLGAEKSSLNGGLHGLVHVITQAGNLPVKMLRSVTWLNG